MTLLIIYTLALFTIIIGLGSLYIPMIEAIPIRWTYYHYHFRKWINASLVLLIGCFSLYAINTGQATYFAIITAVIISILGFIMSIKIHQENTFIAIDNPSLTVDLGSLPISDDMEMALIEYNGISKAYPLDFLIHHHIINDRFNDKSVSLTYCAMCRSIIPFDVTDIGYLFVGSFKGGNMIVSDRKTKTFFQQSTFKSIVGKLHPSELHMIPFQILSWKEIKAIKSLVEVAIVSIEDLKEFELPIPGMWKKLMKSESVPGLNENSKDKTFPARTRVVGITDKNKPNHVYLKSELRKHRIVQDHQNNYILINTENSIIGFNTLNLNTPLDLAYHDNILEDRNSKTQWNIRGKYIAGKIKTNLILLAISDEYWFAWKRFHPDTILKRLHE